MVTFLPLMVQSAAPGGLGRLLLSSGCFCCCAGAVSIGCVRAAAAIGCAKTKATSMKMASAGAEKCLTVMMMSFPERISLSRSRAADGQQPVARDYFCRGARPTFFQRHTARRSRLLAFDRGAGGVEI